MASQGLIKVTEENQDTKYRRVAKFLTIIGVDQASKVIALLPQDMVDLIIPEIATIRNIPASEAESIMNEFHSLLVASKVSGGVQTAKDILEKTYGKEKAEQVLNKAVPFKKGKPFGFLESENSIAIYAILKDESDYIRSLVLSYLPSVVAADVIKQMSEEEKKETVLRMARISEIDSDTLVRIDAAIFEKNEKLKASKADTATNSIDGRNALAEILKHMTPQGETTMLEKIAESDPELSDSLKDKLFTLDDIILCQGRYLQEYLRTMDDRKIALLIAGKKEGFRQKIFQNVSTGRGDMILEEEQLILPVRKTDSDIATSQFMAAMRCAWEKGDLFIPGRDEEEYVL